MQLTELRGVIPPIATPFDEAGEVDLVSLRKLTNYLIDGGVHGRFYRGSTGDRGTFNDYWHVCIVRTDS